MKTKLICLLVLIALVLSSAAQIVVTPPSEGGGGGGSTTNSPLFEFTFLSPTENLQWSAGGVGGIKYRANGLIGYSADVYLEGAEYGRYVSHINIQGDGNDADAFTVPFGTQGGEYRIRVSVYDPYTGEWILSILSDAIVTVSSAVSSPSSGDTIAAGHRCQVAWSGQDITEDFFTFYLKLVDYPYTVYHLKSAPVWKGKTTVPIPGNIPSGRYRLSLLSWYSSSTTSDIFTVQNKRRHGGVVSTSGGSKGAKLP